MALLGVLSPILFLLVQSTQVPSDLILCENTRVHLGQAKQDVRNALAACCQVSNAQFPSTEPQKVTEYPNQIVFKDKEGNGSCEGSIMFNKQEKLVRAERVFADLIDYPASGQRIDGLSLSRAVTKAFDTLFFGQPSSVNNKVNAAAADIETQKIAGPTGYGITDFVTSGGRTLRFEVNESGTNTNAGGGPIRIVRVNVEIGDFRDADMTAVPVKLTPNR